MSHREHTNKKETHNHPHIWVTYRWEPGTPGLTLSASAVAAEARERLEPDWTLLRLSATEKQNRHYLSVANLFPLHYYLHTQKCMTAICAILS